MSGSVFIFNHNLKPLYTYGSEKKNKSSQIYE